MLHVLVTLSVVGLGGLLHPVAPPPVTTGLVGPLVLLNVLVWRQFFEAGGVPFAPSGYSSASSAARRIGVPVRVVAPVRAARGLFSPSSTTMRRPASRAAAGAASRTKAAVPTTPRHLIPSIYRYRSP